LAGVHGIYTTENMRRLLTLKDKHKGERGFVIGSGPSLNKVDLTPLKNEVTFVSNAFYHLFDQMGFMPTYYTVEDPLPAEDNADVLNHLEGTTKIFTHDLRYCLKPTPNTTYVFFDRHYATYPAKDFPRFSMDASRCIFWGGTVAYMGLQLAYYMGIRQVYLLGIDLDYKVPEDVRDNAVIMSNQADVNHFHPDYFGPGKRWHHPMVERMARSFEHAGEFFKAHGGAIYNATVGGKLESLLRVPLDKVVPQSH